MSLLDTIADIFSAGPDDWRARLQSEIVLLSPNGNEFTAKWEGDERNKTKKLGIFSYPLIAGNIIQDLDVDSTHYKMSIFFDGKDCDIVSSSFFKAAGERGCWTITHPTYGFLELQLISIKELNAPVASGGIVAVETEWIEPIDESTLMTAAEIAAAADASIDDLNVSAAEQFAASLDVSTQALQESVSTVVNGVTSLTDAALGPLVVTVDALSSAINIIQNGITDTLNASALDVFSLAGQMQQLIQLPSLANADLHAKQDAYSKLTDDLISGLPGASEHKSVKNKNSILVFELSLSSVLAVNAKIATMGGEGQSGAVTRTETVDAAISVSAALNEITESLDESQKNYKDELFQSQYFSQQKSFQDAAHLTALAVQYLLLSVFNLKTERRFILSRARSPLEIASAEYRGLGAADANYDLFLESNNLQGDEIYLLPAGREVIIYV
jgi:hypothetical protein